MRLLLVLGLVYSCGGEEQSASPPPETEANEATPQTESATSETTPSEVEPPPDEVAPEEPAEPVDLLRTVPNRVRASSYYRGDSSQIERLTDNDLETAWNSETMEAGATDSHWITVALPIDAQVQSVALTAGYTKVNRGRDLFVQNLRVRHVRIHHGSDVFEADLDIDDRGLQVIPVNGNGGHWRIEIDAWEPGEREDYREICVSEIRFTGIAGTSAELPALESMELTDAELEAEMAEADEEMAALDAELEAQELADLLESEDIDEGVEDPSDETSGTNVVLRPGAGLRLADIVLAPEVEGRTPIDPRFEYSKDGDEQVYCYFRLNNPDREETEVTIAWENADGASRNDPTAIDVPGNRTFTHWRYTSTGWRRPGEYRCVIRNGAGQELGHATFDLSE